MMKFEKKCKNPEKLELIIGIIDDFFI